MFHSVQLYVWMFCILITTLLNLSDYPPKADAPSKNALSEKPTFSMCRTGGSFKLEPLVDYQEPIAPKLKGLGNLHFKVTTDSKEAQAFFDQGLRLVYAFNHGEAYRAFQEASRLDPKMSMAYWGQALSLGPNINDPLPDLARQKLAHQAIQKAKERMGTATELEQAMISAYESRCTNNEVEQSTLNLHYQEAMKSVYQRFGDHPEVGIAFATSIMNTMPWDYYDEHQQPKAMTNAAIEALEKIMNDDPDHPGAHHYYIHVIESVDPYGALGSARALEDLMPGAGHLVHMPSHIYIGTGMYSESAEVNRAAIKADEEYIAQCQAQGMYPMVYYPHNIHFLWASCSMLGSSQEAIDAAEKVALKVTQGLAADFHFLQDFMSVPYQAYVRFGRWNEILTAPMPDTALLHVGMMWHYARGIAFARKGMMQAAEMELVEVRRIANDPRTAELLAAYTNPTSEVGKIAVAHLAGEVAAEKGDFDAAISHLKEAVEYEMNLVYQEPSAWHYPTRHALGAVLLQAGQAVEAESVYRADLEINKNNGWTLFGLYQSLIDQEKSDEAKKVRKKFEDAWAHADVALTASRF